MLLQIPYNFAYPVTLDIEIEDFAHDLSFFVLHGLQNGFAAAGIEEVGLEESKIDDTIRTVCPQRNTVFSKKI